MKKSLIALAVLGASGAAMAQSSVTLFGIVDATYAIGRGDTSNKNQLTNSGYNSSRLGFRGSDDIGGGLKGSFHLEAGLNNDDGSGQATSNNNQAAPAADPVINGRNQGLTFGRRSTVSLEGSFGEVRLGRDYTPQFWSVTAYDPFGTNGVGTTQVLLTDSSLTKVRASNSIGYLSPSFGGVKVWFQTYMGENASTAAKAGSGNAIRVSFDQGPISAAVAFSSTTTGAGTTSKTTNFGGSYDLGVAKLMGMVETVKNTGAVDFKGYQFGAHVPVGSGTIRASVSNGKRDADKTSKFAIGYVHDLSKRTSLYTTFASLSNKGAAAQALNGAATPAGGKSTGFDFGIKTSF
ncbi:MAG: porin [Burkholderiales bacterium]|nr:porin [Burkholderiales bacterium]